MSRWFLCKVAAIRLALRMASSFAAAHHRLDGRAAAMFSRVVHGWPQSHTWPQHMTSRRTLPCQVGGCPVGSVACSRALLYCVTSPACMAYNAGSPLEGSLASAGAFPSLFAFGGSSATGAGSLPTGLHVATSRRASPCTPCAMPCIHRQRCSHQCEAQAMQHHALLDMTKCKQFAAINPLSL